MPLYKVLSKCFIFINLLSKRNKSLPCKSLSGSPSPYLMEGLDHRVLPAEPRGTAAEKWQEKERKGRRQEQADTATKRADSWASYFLSEQVLPKRPAEPSQPRAFVLGG